LRKLRNDLHFSADIFSALHALQPAGALPGTPTALCGELLLGQGIAKAQGP